MSGNNIPTQNTTQRSNKISISKWTYPAAAVLIGALVTWFFMDAEANNYKKEIAEQSIEIEELRRDYDKVNEIYAYINHGGTRPYILEGKNRSNESQVIVYWNTDLRKSMLRVIDLPSIRSNETYQLWADVNGKMKSLGTFNAALAINDAIPINYLDDATSLNITVEPKGGSEHPTLSTLTANRIM